MIQTFLSLNENKLPVNVTEDSLGTPINIGHRVAYSRSGNVTIGTLLEIKRNEWKESGVSYGGYQGWRLDFEVHIKNEDDQKISKIKNPNSFVII